MSKVGRPKTIDEETLEELFTLLESYYIECCQDNLTEITAASFGKYLRNKGMDIKDYTLRRCNEINARIKELNKLSDKDNFVARAVSFQNLDVNQFIRSNNTPEKLKKALILRDKYYEKISKSCIYYMKKYKEYKKLLEEKEADNKVVEKDAKAAKDTIYDLKEQNKKLNSEIKELTNYINTYVNPEIASVLLQESNDKAAGTIAPQIVDEQAVKDNVMRPDTQKRFDNNIIQGLFNKIDED